MTSKQNILRSFGMSAAQIVSELQNHERRFGVSLTPKNNDPSRAITGYDQFPLEIRKTASRMSEYYEIFFCLENSIRRLIESTMIEAEGKDWWLSSRVEEGFRTEVANLRAKESKGGISPRSDSNLDYLRIV